MPAAPDHFYQQSGVIPYRFNNGRLEVMLITSRRRKRWVIPKGVVEPHLSPADSAAQEAWEEAGLSGQVSEEAVGRYRYEKWSGICHVEVFLLPVDKVHAEWPEDYRLRSWLSPEEAASRVDEPVLKRLLRNAPDLVGPDELLEKVCHFERRQAREISWPGDVTGVAAGAKSRAGAGEPLSH